METLLNYLHTFFRINFQKAFQRFPTTVTLAIVATAIALLELFLPNILGLKGENFARLEMFLFSMVLLSYSIALFREQQTILPQISWLFGLVIAAITGFNFFTTQNIEIALFFTIGAFTLALFSAPYFMRNIGDEACCQHNTFLTSNLAFAILSNLILCGGLSLILLSTGYLFEFDIHHKLYSTIWIIGSGIFAPIYVLANTPAATSLQQTEYEPLTYPKGVTFIVRYLLCPLVLVYATILYAYGAKILLQMELPKGHLTWMVGSFSIVGLLTYIATYPLAVAQIRIAKLIRNHLFKIIWVPAILLLVAIGVRVQEYGITWQRYAVILFALWLAGTTLYMSLSRTKSFNLLLSSLVVLLILGSVGPWSANSISNHSQTNQLKRLLTEHNMLQNDKAIAVATPSDFTNKQVSQLRSIIRYLVRHDEEGNWREWLPALAKPRNNPSTNDYMTALGFPNSYNSRWAQGDELFRHNIMIQRGKRDGHHSLTVNVKGYDIMTRFYIHGTKAGKKPKMVKRQLPGLEKPLKLSSSDMKIHLHYDGKQLTSFDLAGLYPALKEKKLPLRISKEHSELLEFTTEAEGWKFKLLLDQLSLKENAEGVVLHNCNGTLLLVAP